MEGAESHQTTESCQIIEPQLSATNNNNEDGSSNFGFEDNLSFGQQSIEKEPNFNDDDANTRTESFIADLAEENANSFPSACEDTSLGIINNDNDFVKMQSVDFNIASEESTDKTEDTYAECEDIKPNEQATDLDAENISEDELPIPSKPKIQDAEEVSDDELPGPKLAELPADTEIVSEEEFPASNSITKNDGKRKIEDYDPSEPTEESDIPEKKIKKENGKLIKISRKFV